MMDTEKFDKLFTQRSSVFLKKIDYNNYPISVDTAEFSMKDKVKILAEDEMLIIEFTRFVGLNPESLFDLTVSVSQKYIFEKKEDLNQGELYEFLLKTDNIVLGSLMQVASCLISQITSTGGGLPIITPPSLSPDAELETM